jgi:hypothetical protein
MIAGGVPASVASLVLFLAVFLFLARHTSIPGYRELGVVALIGRGVIAVIIIPNLPYGWDITQFSDAAVSILSGSPTGESLTVSSFAALQSIIYVVFGIDPVVVAVFSGFCAVLVAIPTADLARRLYPSLDGTSGITATVLFLPLPFFFLTLPIRDALDVLLLFTLLAAVARAYDGNRWPAILAIPLWGALTLLRPELGAVFLAGTITGGVVKILDTSAIQSLTVRGLSALVAFPSLIAIAIVTPRIPVAPFTERLQKRAVGGAAYLEPMTYESGVDILLAAPARAVYFQYTPFPLHVTSPFDYVTVLMLPALILLTVAAYRSARECERDTAVLVLLLTTYLLGIVGYGLIDSNFGTTVRHRIPFTFILCILAAPTLERWANLLVPFGADTAVDHTSTTERIGD